MFVQPTLFSIKDWLNHFGILSDPSYAEKYTLHCTHFVTTAPFHEGSFCTDFFIVDCNIEFCPTVNG